MHWRCRVYIADDRGIESGMLSKSLHSENFHLFGVLIIQDPSGTPFLTCAGS